eukprot:TRINITY_DN1043_c2_g2_i1.p1 TRINITY_DN1043_c2_g2~~TRINITY_DN1043_c2_g2_i1.p1  ORF type:complete len:2181 (-),score=931.38 TRINITY_DN1043_c2_g2_i1:102-6644(-)
MRGHRGGGDELEIMGCGYEEFSVEQLSVIIGGGSTELCVRGLNGDRGTLDDTLKIETEVNEDHQDRIVCTTAATDCFNGVSGGNTVEVLFRTEIPTINDVSLGSITYESGPWFDVTTMTPTRGQRTGSTTVSIRGSSFYFSGDSDVAGWNVRVNFTPTESSYPDDDASTNDVVTIESVMGTIETDEIISFQTPPGLFNLDVYVTFDFGFGETLETFVADCTAFPVLEVDEINPLVYHYGPTCGSISPSSGHFSGGDTIEITGEGFLEAGNIPTDTEVRFCLQRLINEKNFFEDECIAEQTGITVTSSKITVETPNNRLNVNRSVGYNRFYGDTSDVYVHFFAPGGDNEEFPRNQLLPNEDVARILCPVEFVFGAVIDSVTPDSGSVSDRYLLHEGKDDEYNQSLTTITISGSNFVDESLNEDNIQVLLGNLALNDAEVVNDTEIKATTRWVDSFYANHDVDVSIIMDTCNQTYSGITHGYGPKINKLVGPFGEAIVNEFNTNGDIWGLHPGIIEFIQVIGEKFSDFYDEHRRIFHGQCVFNDNNVGLETIYVHSELVLCVTEGTFDFGDWGSLGIRFGPIATDNYPNQYKANDYKKMIYADQKIHFTPRIDMITPLFGKTTGNAPVTIIGEGFTPVWDIFECFFGHYSDHVHAQVGDAFNEVYCTTPAQRGEFNTDVTVHIQLSQFFDDDGIYDSYYYDDDHYTDDDYTVDDDDASSRQFSLYRGIDNSDFKVISPMKYHYGPICYEVTPNNIPTTGQNNIVVIGEGFTDCIERNEEPFSDCVFDEYQVIFKDPVTGVRTFLESQTNRTGIAGNNDIQLKFNAPENPCMYEPIVEIAFHQVVITSVDQNIIECKTNHELLGTDGEDNTDRDFFFHYGPTFTAQTSQFFENGVSYGWENDAITITGRNFIDPNIFSSSDDIKCFVGDKEGSIDFVSGSGSTLRCVLPENEFNSQETLRIEWQSNNKYTCVNENALIANEIHYGPVIRDSFPNRGYVEDQTEITINGFAFDCCGIEQVRCLFPSGAVGDDNSVLSDRDTLTCNVPQNTDIDVLITNIGVGFTSPSFNGVEQQLTHTENEGILTFFYGPSVTTINPKRVSLSGRDEVIQILGEGFNDPYLLEVFCDFYSFDGTNENLEGSIAVEKSEKGDTFINCKVPEFSRNCGDIDLVRPRWRRNGESLRPELGRFYYKTLPSTSYLDLNINNPPTFVDGGSTTPFFIDGLVYGPEIQSICHFGDDDDNVIPEVFTSLDTPTTVTDLLPTVQVSITVPADAQSAGVITDVNVEINLLHTFISDLIVSLTSPQGTTITLIDYTYNFNGCDNERNLKVVFDQQSRVKFLADGECSDGIYQPTKGSLDTYNGEIAAGVWTLNVNDAFSFDHGLIESFSLTFDGSLPVQHGQICDDDDNQFVFDYGPPERAYFGSNLFTIQAYNFDYFYNYDIDIVTSMTVFVDMDHSSLNSFYAINLISPSGTTITLYNLSQTDNYYNLYCYNEDLRITFDDTAYLSSINYVNSVYGSCGFEGSFKPVEPLSTFNGEPITGEWTLEIINYYGFDTVLDQFTLAFNGAEFCDDDEDDIYCDHDIKQSSIFGGHSYRVSFDNLRDFVSDSDTNDFGSGMALCMFGQMASESLSPIVQDPNNNSNGYVDCIVPPGLFDWYGEISVILNPNFNHDYNILSDSFHWLPYASSLNRNYIHMEGHETVIINGNGFASYDTVTCKFGSDFSVESDITNDYTISCVTPPNSPIGNLPLELSFCTHEDDEHTTDDDNDSDYYILYTPDDDDDYGYFYYYGYYYGYDDDFYFGDDDDFSIQIIYTDDDTGDDNDSGNSAEQCICNSVDTIPVFEKINYFGINKILPNEGPICGSTLITLNGWGFSNFDQITCSFDSQSQNFANIISDTEITCLSPDYSEFFDSDLVSCISASLILERFDQKETLVWPINFEYGFPQVLTVSPSSIDIDDLPSTIEIFGDYFNGGIIGTGSYECTFGDLPAVPGEISPLDDDNDGRKVICDTNDAGLFTIGEYNVEVKYTCSQNERFTLNNVPLTITQNPSIRDVNPNSSPEIGGVKITVSGSNFNGGTAYFCSFGDFEEGTNTLVSASYSEETSTISCKSPYFPEAIDEERLDFAITIDGGKTFARARTQFTVQKIYFVDDEDGCLESSFASSLSPISFFISFLFSFIFIILFSC